MDQQTNLVEDLFAVALPPGGSEWRRAVPRRAVRARMCVRLAEHHGRVLFGYTLNVTPQALCITLHEALEPYSTVEIDFAEARPSTGGWVQAVVVHHTQTLNGFKTGLRVAAARGKSAANPA